MTARLGTFVVDCREPRALADFYAGLTGWTVVEDSGDWVTLRGGEGGVDLAFQESPDHEPPVWRDPARPQQYHLDLFVDDADAAESEAVALGAVLLEGSEGHSGFRVYRDPAGHTFCLCTG